MVIVDHLLDLLPAGVLERLEARYELDGEHQVKLTGAAVFVCLLNSVLNNPAATQRLIGEAFAHRTGKSVHQSGVSRFLSVVNPAFFKAVFEHLYTAIEPAMTRGEASSLGLPRAKGRTRFIDATSVTLSAKLMAFGLLGARKSPATKERAEYRTVKSVMSLSEEGLPCLLRLCSDPSEHEDSHALGPSMLQSTRPGDLWVFDGGCKDRQRLADIHQAGGFYITPQGERKVGVCQVLWERPLTQEQIEQLPPPPAKPGKGQDSNDLRAASFRLVRVERAIFLNAYDRPKARARLEAMPLVVVHGLRWDLRTKRWKPLVLVSNLPLSEDATRAGPYTFRELATLYRLRWQIELLFKLLKQHLGYAHLTSRNANGILVMVYVCLCAAVLLAWYKRLSGIDRGWRSVRYWLGENVREWTQALLTRPGALYAADG